MKLKKGTLLLGGKYRIESVLGQGGFGITYLAMQSGLNRKVAIKEFFMSDFCERDPETSNVSLGTSGSRETVEKFKRKFIKEASNIARLNNPHIIRIIENFEENGTAYYVMDYIEGQSLKDMLYPNKTLQEVVALNYIRQVSDALAEVHANDMLHLDIKPGNIMIDSKGSVVLIDFGISKRFDGGSGSEKLTTTTTLPYTPGYAPLEQMDQDGSKLTPASDIYALGATLYRLLSGETPPTATTRARRKNVESLPESVSSSVRNAVNAAMLIDEEDRPQSVAEFLAMLDTPIVVENDSEKTEFDVDESTVHTGDEDKGGKADNNGNASKVADSRPATFKSEKNKGKLWMLWVLIALIGIGVGIGFSALFMGGSPAQVETDDEKEDTDPCEVIAVDLGLSVKWADRNVGANSPEDYGSYFAWGETHPKSTYEWSNYKWCEGGCDQLTKYCTDSDYGYNGFTDGKTSLEPADDAATVNMGSNWRMPTKAELEELENNCIWTWTNQKGVNGYKVTGPNSKSIFLPAAGCYEDYSILEKAEKGCFYWSRMVDKHDLRRANNLFYTSDEHGVDDLNFCSGLTVRAVVR